MYVTFQKIDKMPCEYELKHCNKTNYNAKIGIQIIDVAHMRHSTHIRFKYFIKRIHSYEECLEKPSGNDVTG